MSAPDRYAAHERRDRIVRRCVWGTLALLLGIYFCADTLYLLPEAVSIRAHTGNRNRIHIPDRYEEFDPDLVLGIAIGDTRFRLNHAHGRAIVTRPIFGVTHWVIPSTFDYQGRTFTVTALDPFALLNAQGVRTLSLPPTLRHTNEAENFPAETLETITLRLPDGAERILSPPFPSPLLPEQQEPPTQ